MKGVEIRSSVCITCCERNDRRAVDMCILMIACGSVGLILGSTHCCFYLGIINEDLDNEHVVYSWIMTVITIIKIIACRNYND